MSAGLLFAMTLPGLVVLLVVLAVVQRFFRGRRPVGTAGIEALSAVLSPGSALQQEQQRVQDELRDDEGDGAPRESGSR